jgi:hypothetical protein
MSQKNDSMSLFITLMSLFLSLFVSYVAKNTLMSPVCLYLLLSCRYSCRYFFLMSLFMPLFFCHVPRVSLFYICSIFNVRDSVSTIYVFFLRSSLLSLDVHAERLRGIAIQEDRMIDTVYLEI